MVYTGDVNRFFQHLRMHPYGFLGRRQVVRHKTLDLVSQVRVLAPQPKKRFTVIVHG